MKSNMYNKENLATLKKMDSLPLLRTVPGVTSHASHHIRPQPPAPAHGLSRPPQSLSLGVRQNPPPTSQSL